MIDPKKYCYMIMFKIKVASNNNNSMKRTNNITQSTAPYNKNIRIKSKEDEMVRQHHSMNMNSSRLWEIVKDREAWHAAVHRIAKSQT